MAGLGRPKDGVALLAYARPFAFGSYRYSTFSLG